ncbi:hypothetical protein APHAL10511_000418 [Amanita phalloides]|nr:hypothetical protein APHAL10511_000418 [Amanita phalloides]
MGMYDEYSDLTDIESDGYGVSSSKKKSGAKEKATASTGGFRVKNALKVPRPTTYTVQALYEQIHSCDINLEPDYQRDVVWPEAKQIGIIDSIFRNFYIPPVIFAVNTSDDGSETRTCIDGKQRLTSMYRFMDGLIPHKDPFTSEKLWYKDAGQSKGSRNKKILPEKYRRLFANKQIVCVEYHDITDQDEREIFQRVQLGMALTPAEKLQVINSPRAQFIRELQANYLKEQGGGLNTSALDWDRSRGADFRCLAQAIYTIDKYSAASKTAPTILQLEKWLSDGTALTPTFQSKIQDTFSILVLLVHEKSTKAVFKKHAKVSPVEFVLIVVLIAVWKDKMSLAELSEAIGNMREDVRVYHADIRMNTKVTKTMLDFMRGLKASKTLPEQSAGAVVKSNPPLTSGEKRKRGVNKMEVDDGTIDDSDSRNQSEDEQLAKKMKRSAAAAAITSNTATTSPPNPRPTLTARPSAALRLASEVPTGEKDQPQLLQSQTQPQTQPQPMPPTFQAAPPRMDRLAGVRAARAAAGLGQSQTQTQVPPIGPARTQSILNGDGLKSPRTPTALPSPGLTLMGFKGGIGVPISSSQPVNQFSPSSSNTNAIPIPVPPTLSSNSAEPMSWVPPILNSGREETERQRKERERWEVERYGRVQHHFLPEHSGWGVNRKSR